MESNIKIVRLQNGEDIIGSVADLDYSQYNISEPMSVAIDYRQKTAGLVMHHWLPVQLIKKNEITINIKDVLCLLEPNDEFVEYYTNTVEKIRELLDAKNLVDGLKDDELEDVMYAFEELEQDGTTLH